MAYNPLQTFLQEAEELIADIEQAALELSGENESAETINRLFRAFHTIKGSGAMCGLDGVAAFTHHVESLLDDVRADAVPVSGPLIELILKATDHIKVLLSAAQSDAPVEPAEGEALIAKIAELARKGAPATAPAAKPETVADTPAEGERTWEIRFHPNPGMLANGGNPGLLIRDLRKLGNCAVVAHDEDVPALEEIQSDRCYLWWTVTLRSACGIDAIRDVFLFVEDDGNLAIEEIAQTSVPATRPEASAAKPAEAAPAEEAHKPDSAAEASKPDAAEHRHRQAAREATVRVPAERLDRLVNLVGEFVMNQSCLAQAVSQSSSQEFANPVQVLERLVAELRDNVLGIRMLPIGTLFGRFRRVVHDLSKDLGKEADLVMEGAETELDKSILDVLGEPLVHCLRNCLDHGAETAAERIQNGKPPRATIRLSAEHSGSNVVISIEDDGRGINKAAVRAKAIEKQLISPDARLNDRDLYNLILLPGFSTARQVTSVSGRGVGMDVVKRQIDALRGSLAIESKEGHGTRVSITLPLTLAIIDGLLVEVEGEQFIIPMSAITENVELPRSDRLRNNGRNVLAVRGELVSYIDLREAFSTAGEAPKIAKVVIARYGDDRIGLVVDRVLGTHQTVIQSLGKFYRDIEVVSGATIMGDGRVALILDIAAIVRHIERQCHAAVAAPATETEAVAVC